jgi:hypothetical protein
MNITTKKLWGVGPRRVEQLYLEGQEDRDNALALLDAADSYYERDGQPVDRLLVAMQRSYMIARQLAHLQELNRGEQSKFEMDLQGEMARTFHTSLMIGAASIALENGTPLGTTLANLGIQEVKA